MAMDSVSVVRVIFGVIVAIGVYLTYVGWVAKPRLAIGNEQSVKLAQGNVGNVGNERERRQRLLPSLQGGVSFVWQTRG